MRRKVPDTGINEVQDIDHYFIAIGREPEFAFGILNRLGNLPCRLTFHCYSQVCDFLGQIRLSEDQAGQDYWLGSSRIGSFECLDSDVICRPGAGSNSLQNYFFCNFGAEFGFPAKYFHGSFPRHCFNRWFSMHFSCLTIRRKPSVGLQGLFKAISYFGWHRAIVSYSLLQLVSSALLRSRTGFGFVLEFRLRLCLCSCSGHG